MGKTKRILTDDYEFLGNVNLLKASKSTPIANVTSTPPSQITAQTITTIEEAQTAINNLITIINSLQANNTELTTKLNAKLAADRASGQQAT